MRTSSIQIRPTMCNKLRIVRNPHAYNWHPIMGGGAAGARDDRLTQLSPSAFTIHPSDTLKPNMFADGAPSRPPSRVSLGGNDLPDRTPILLEGGRESKLTSTIQSEIRT